jgi:hypothetical protein
MSSSIIFAEGHAAQKPLKFVAQRDSEFCGNTIAVLPVDPFKKLFHLFLNPISLARFNFS